MRALAVRTICGVAAVCAVVGCKNDAFKSSSERQLDRIANMEQRSREYEQLMINNGVMADMSLAEFHFMPHSMELSGNGVARLDRMAVMLDTYGGNVRYAAAMGDDELVSQRIGKVREYLAMTGCNLDGVTIEPGLPGGSGVSSRRALAKQEKMDNPPDQGSSVPQLLGAASQ